MDSNNKEALENLKKDLDNLRFSSFTPEEFAEVREFLDEKLAELRFYERRQYYIHY